MVFLWLREEIDQPLKSSQELSPRAWEPGLYFVL